MDAIGYSSHPSHQSRFRTLPRRFAAFFILFSGVFALQPMVASTQEKQDPNKEDGKKNFPSFGFKDKGGFGGPGGKEGGVRKIVEKFDKDGDGRLNAEERKAARESLKSSNE